MDECKFKRFLETGEVAGVDESLDLTGAALKGWHPPMKAMPKPTMPPKSNAGAGVGNSPGGLDAHDKKYHPNGYKEGDSCNLRDSQGKKDDADALGSKKGSASHKIDSYLRMGAAETLNNQYRAHNHWMQAGSRPLDKSLHLSTNNAVGAVLKEGGQERTEEVGAEATGKYESIAGAPGDNKAARTKFLMENQSILDSPAGKTSPYYKTMLREFDEAAIEGLKSGLYHTADLANAGINATYTSDDVKAIYREIGSQIEDQWNKGEEGKFDAIDAALEGRERGMSEDVWKKPGKKNMVLTNGRTVNLDAVLKHANYYNYV